MAEPEDGRATWRFIEQEWKYLSFNAELHRKKRPGDKDLFLRNIYRYEHKKDAEGRGVLAFYHEFQPDLDDPDAPRWFFPLDPTNEDLVPRYATVHAKLMVGNQPAINAWHLAQTPHKGMDYVSDGPVTLATPQRLWKWRARAGFFPHPTLEGRTRFEIHLWEPDDVEEVRAVVETHGLNTDLGPWEQYPDLEWDRITIDTDLVLSSEKKDALVYGMYQHKPIEKEIDRSYVNRFAGRFSRVYYYDMPNATYDDYVLKMSAFDPKTPHHLDVIVTYHNEKTQKHTARRNQYDGMVYRAAGPLHARFARHHAFITAAFSPSPHSQNETRFYILLQLGRPL